MTFEQYEMKRLRHAVALKRLFREKPGPRKRQGGRPKGRRVRCEDGREWPSVYGAARDMGVTPNAVYTAASGGSRCRGLRFEFVEPSRRKGKPVRCVDTGEVFEDAYAAARFAERTAQSMYQALRDGIRCAGRRWEFVDSEQQERMVECDQE